MQQTPVLNNIVEQYADEIAFLYTQRQNALSSPVYYLDEIQALENRLIAHLEGLKLGGVIGWEYCEENLQFEQAGELFAAAFSAVHMQDMDKLDQVFDVAGEEAVLLDAIADAFIWQFHEFTPMLANGLYNTKKPQKMYTALCLYRSIASVPDTVVEDALMQGDKLVYGKAVSLVADLGLKHFVTRILAALDDEDEDKGFSAAWCATRFGNFDGLCKLKQFVWHEAYADKALHLIVMQKDKEDTLHLLNELYANKQTSYRALDGMAYFGNPVVIPVLIDVMKEESLARRAGYAFSFITGMDLEANNLSAGIPDGFEIDPEEVSEEENIGLDRDADLPWPDFAKIAAWWADSENRHRFSNSDRYLAGEVLTKAKLKSVLSTGNQWQRIFSANCLGAYEQSLPTFDVYAPVIRQKNALENSQS